MLRVVLGVTGGISAYKATEVIRGFTELGHEVKVIPTANALRFIGAATLEALSHNTVDSDLYSDVADVKHVKLGQESDLIVVAPATASFLARFAAGLADDLLLNTLLVATSPVLVVPAMHTEMWNHPATQDNVAKLRSRGITVLEPDSGRLTGADTGPGRLPEPNAIVQCALKLAEPAVLANLTGLRGKKILVTAGGTHEPIDTVRFIANRSSGKQGIEIAKAAAAAGAIVQLIACNVDEPISGLGTVIRVSTAAELQTAVVSRVLETDVLVMAAAVADYRVANPSQQKMKRSLLGEEISLTLISNPDILKESVALIGQHNKKVFTVGFAAEVASTDDELASLAALKLAQKGVDLVAANNVAGGAVFGSNENRVALVARGKSPNFSQGTKAEIAVAILESVSKSLSH